MKLNLNLTNDEYTSLCVAVELRAEACKENEERKVPGVVGRLARLADSRHWRRLLAKLQNERHHGKGGK